MPDASEPLIRLAGVSKEYQALRPLRIAELTLAPGQSVALVGLDGPMAEVLVNLITGASVPDAGEVVSFGQRTTEIRDSRAWLAILDQFGLISERAVLVDQLTVEQSLAMPLTLELDDLPSPIKAQTRALASEVGLSDADLAQHPSALTPGRRLRLRLGRALALGPRVVLAEHPNATLPPDEVAAFAADYAGILARRGLAALTMTADRTFAAAVGGTVLTHHAASGVFKPSSGWRRWF